MYSAENGSKPSSVGTVGGSSIIGLQVKFEGGRAVEVTSEENGEVLSEYLKRDDGSNRLGEVALVDGAGRIVPGFPISLPSGCEC